MAKNAFKWPKSKKVQKADPNYFSILHENMSPNFFWGPPGLRKWHYLLEFPREKVVTHLKIFLRVIQNFWHGRNACDKKIVRDLLEDQCELDILLFCGVPLTPGLSSLPSQLMTEMISRLRLGLHGLLEVRLSSPELTCHHMPTRVTGVSSDLKEELYSLLTEILN